MRALRRPLTLLLLCAGALAPGCDCARPPATAITLVATNDLEFDIFVPNDAQQGGLTVGHALSSGELAPVAEAPACACLGCDTICQNPDCQCTAQPMAHRIRKGEKFTRRFDGNEHVATRADCGAGDLGPVCLQAGAPIAAGSYALQLCYATSVPGASQGADDFPATFDPKQLNCVTKSFGYPDQTTWEVAPPPPAPCGPGAECPGEQLCQKGVCSATCLANDVPPLGNGWDVAISIIDDQAFFTQSGTGVVAFDGTGQVGQANYLGSDMRLTLTRAVGVGHASGQIEVALPKGVTPVPFLAGETVAVHIVQAGAARKNSAAVTIRDAAGNLLLAADMGRGGPLLTASDLAPFSVGATGLAFACNQSDVCGRRVHRGILFSAGSAQVEVEPGKGAPVTVGSQGFVATAIENYADASGSSLNDCDPEGLLEFDVAAVRQL